MVISSASRNLDLGIIIMYSTLKVFLIKFALVKILFLAMRYGTWKLDKIRSLCKSFPEAPGLHPERSGQGNETPDQPDKPGRPGLVEAVVSFNRL